MRRYTKIKIVKEGGMYLEYQESRKKGEGWDDYTLRTKDNPLPGFVAAFKALAMHVVDMCELPDSDLAENRVEVRGVSFSYGGDKEVMGAVLTAVRELKRSNTPLNLNTPHKPSEPYNDPENGGSDKLDEKSLLDEDCVAALEKLCKEADRFLGGHRQQVDLFTEPVAASAV